MGRGEIFSLFSVLSRKFREELFVAMCFKQLKNDNGFSVCKLKAIPFVSATSSHHLKTENESLLSNSSETKLLVIRR